MKPEFDEVYSENAPSILRYVRRLSGSRDQAEDVLQETFLRFYKQLELDIEIENYRAWLFRVASNIVKDRRRSETRSAIREQSYSLGGTVVDFRKDYEIQQTIKRAVTGLSPRMKMVLLLSAEGFSYREISSITHIESAYVGVILQRARQAFRKNMESGTQVGTEPKTASQGGQQ